MAYTNYPSAGAPPDRPEEPKDNRKLIYGVLIAALLGTWGYIVYDKNKSKEVITQLQTSYSNVDSARNVVQEEYNQVLSRMDSLTGSNTQLQGALAERKAEIDRLRQSIKGELSKNNADVTKARAMIAELNGKLNNLLAEIDQLKQENEKLTTSNKQLTVERDTLSYQKQALTETLTVVQTRSAELEDIASTLHASNINIAAIDVRGSGKEKATTTAKRADKLRISFDIDENRIASSGSKEIYVVVTGPDGKPVTIPSNGSGTFTTRDEGEKVFTSKVDLQYEQGKRTPVSFDWKQDNNYQTGAYKIEIYHNGYKIGEGVKTLKKGGLFG
jgi:predicted  nucleic acid-binding Zn-ribbon protein